METSSPTTLKSSTTAWLNESLNSETPLVVSPLINIDLAEVSVDDQEDEQQDSRFWNGAPSDWGSDPDKDIEQMTILRGKLTLVMYIWRFEHIIDEFDQKLISDRENTIEEYQRNLDKNFVELKRFINTIMGSYPPGFFTY